ncbi:MAG: hypothetical protein JO026_00945 [Patescibacteria group bacterium]|nr:hypothetical protein [Patescibacteria group bacterium]
MSSEASVNIGRKRISRIEAFQMLASGIVGLVGLGGFVEEGIDIEASLGNISDKSETAVREGKNIRQIETDNAFYSIAYTPHREMSGTKILEGADGVILEFIRSMPTAEAAEKDVASRISGSTTKELFETALFRAGMPVFLGDVVWGQNMPSEKVAADLIIPKWRAENERIQQWQRNETVLGTLLLISSILGKKVTTNRGRFVKTVVGGLGAALMSSIPEKAFLDYAYANSDIENQAAASTEAYNFLATFNNTIHPELRRRLVEERNLILAQHCETIAVGMRQQLGRKPKLGIDVGVLHTGLESQLQRPKERRLRDIAHHFDLFPLTAQRTIARLDARIDPQQGPGIVITMLNDDGIASIAS